MGRMIRSPEPYGERQKFPNSLQKAQKRERELSVVPLGLTLRLCSLCRLRESERSQFGSRTITGSNCRSD
eukprot:3799829-Amphidinium_carterae.1